MGLESLFNILFDINTTYHFVPANLFLLIAALLCLGILLKGNSYVKDEYIPLSLLGFSCLSSMLLEGFHTTAFLQGIVCWGVSIAIHQVYIQNKKAKMKQR